MPSISNITKQYGGMKQKGGAEVFAAWTPAFEEI